MQLFTLSLLWLLIGLIVGALALAARLLPATWGRFGWLSLLAIGAVAGLLGGWLATLLFGRYFGTATALWLSVAAVVLIPRLPHFPRLPLRRPTRA